MSPYHMLAARRVLLMSAHTQKDATLNLSVGAQGGAVSSGGSGRRIARLLGSMEKDRNEDNGTKDLSLLAHVGLSLSIKHGRQSRSSGFQAAPGKESSCRS